MMPRLADYALIIVTVANSFLREVLSSRGGTATTLIYVYPQRNSEIFRHLEMIFRETAESFWKVRNLHLNKIWIEKIAFTLFQSYVHGLK